MSKPGRNDPCSCGSGNKYKRCCLGKEGAIAVLESVPTRSKGSEWFELGIGEQIFARQEAEERFVRLEQRLGFPIPRILADFLFGGEYVVEGSRGFPAEPKDWEVRTTFRLDDGSASAQIDKVYQLLGDAVPAGTLPFAEDWAGNLFCVVLDGTNKEQVVYWNHEREPNDDRVEQVTQNIKEFIDGLVPLGANDRN